VLLSSDRASCRWQEVEPSTRQMFGAFWLPYPAVHQLLAELQAAGMDAESSRLSSCLQKHSELLTHDARALERVHVV
jgi:hypothetical protein